MANLDGIEPPLEGLEASALPLYYRLIILSDCSPSRKYTSEVYAFYKCCTLRSVSRSLQCKVPCTLILAEEDGVEPSRAFLPRRISSAVPLPVGSFFHNSYFDYCYQAVFLFGFRILFGASSTLSIKSNGLTNDSILCNRPSKSTY